MKRLHLFFSLVLMAAAACSQSNPAYSPEIEARIKQVEEHLSGPFVTKGQPAHTLKQRMEHYHVNGLSIAVVHNYQIEWARGYGWADSADQRPVTPQTLFQAASISKSLNAIGVILLAQEGKLDLYSDINNYLTTWKFPYDSLSRGKKITAANLLSHTAGLTIHGFPGYEKGDTLPAIEQVLDGRRPANTAAVRSMYEPGLKSEYSGGGITISQLMVMDVTHEPYDRYMERKVLDPMGMTSSFYTQPAPAKKASLLATAYHADGKPVKGKYHTYPEEAAAGLWTNPTDLCKYIIETQLSYEGRSAKVLSQKYTQLRLAPYIDKSAALGTFIMKTTAGGDWFQHGGANEGFRSQYFGSLTGGDGVVIMVNSDNGGIMQEVINSVATVYGWKDFYKPTVKSFIALSPQELSVYEGRYRYRAKSDMSLEVKVQDGQLLFRQLWDGQESIFYPESDTTFFSLDWGFPIKFAKGQDGKITNVSAFDREYFDKVEP